MGFIGNNYTPRFMQWRTMAALALLEDIANASKGTNCCSWACVFSNSTDSFVDDYWLINHFRFPRAILLEACVNWVWLPGVTHWPVPLQVLTTVGFLTTGALQRERAGQLGWVGIIRRSARHIKFRYDVVNQANIKVQAAARAISSSKGKFHFS